MPGDIHSRKRARGIGDFKLDHRIVQLARFQLLAEHIASAFAGVLARNRVNDAFFGGLMRADLHVLAHVFAGHDDGAVYQITDDLFHIAADIADFGEFRRLDLEKRGPRQFCQAAADLGLAHAGGPDHQDVLGVDFVAQIIAQLLAAPAVAQRYGNGAFGVVLADDKTVKFRDDFAGGQIGHCVIFSTVRLPLV